MKRPLAAMWLAFVAAACLRRPVSAVDPTTKLSYATIVPQPAIDKIDLLVMVDNSVSMEDKQRILASAVPDLLGGLVRPKCVDPRTRVPTNVDADPKKVEPCPPGSEPPFPPITDMHVGVISSSLGGLGGSQCRPRAGLHEDDRGHLLARGPSGDVAAAGDLHFLAWYPDVEANQDKARHPEPPVPKLQTEEALASAMRDLIVGVGQRGCGLEAQLESVFRFLAQPDPWTAIDVAGDAATYAGGVDEELLAQRAAFLRPDSLVAVVVLTDEDDSSADPLSIRGQGWRFMEPAPLPKPTEACADEPASALCRSCAGDASCVGARYTAKEDPLDVRFHDMKRRYGVDPQFPVQRYVDALRSEHVPARDAEHDALGRYVPRAGCTNPLFAAKLPTSSKEELCALERGPRSASLVYFAVIGGVPNTLLPRSAEEEVDWTPIVGRDPEAWDLTGIDPHMRQSTLPRPGLPGPGAADDADPVHGREWTTNGGDLEYACTFRLFDGDPYGVITPARRTCDPSVGFCDCDGESDRPLCAPDDRRVQVLGKAYPTRRPLLVAKGMGEQGIVASLCPKQLTDPEADDYGYRPAVRAIASRLERSLVASCLPRALDRSGAREGEVPCLVLAILPEEGPDDACGRHGLSPPAEAVLRQTREALRAEGDDAAARRPICEVPQVVIGEGEVCKDASEGIAFCYTEAPAITRCAHALTFTKRSQDLVGARFTMQCIQQTD